MMWHELGLLAYLRAADREMKRCRKNYRIAIAAVRNIRLNWRTPRGFYLLTGDVLSASVPLAQPLVRTILRLILLACSPMYPFN
jgi:hypothetical protein